MPYKEYNDNPFDDYQGYDQYGSDIEALMNRLIGQQRMIQATIKDEVDRTMTQITQTADEIRQEVSDFENDVYSEISQTADQIQQTVTDLDDNLQSQITQNANSIQSTVSQIEGLENDVVAAQSSITQLSNEIDLKVSQTDYTGNEIISRINLSGSGALIQGENIDLVGTVNVLSDLTGDLGTINAGTINGVQINSANIDIDEDVRVGNDIFLGDLNSSSSKRVVFNNGARISGGRSGILPVLTLSAYRLTYLGIEEFVLENSSAKGFCGVGGMGAGRQGACAGVGVSFQGEKTPVPSSINLTTSAGTRQGQVIDINKYGFFLYIEGEGSELYLFWRGEYRA